MVINDICDQLYSLITCNLINLLNAQLRSNNHNQVLIKLINIKLKIILKHDSYCRPYDVVVIAGKSRASELFILFAVANPEIECIDHVVGVSCGHVITDVRTRHPHFLAGLHGLVRKVGIMIIPVLK